MNEELCECGHLLVDHEHFVKSTNCFGDAGTCCCQQFKRKESDDMQHERSVKPCQPRPESQERVGAHYFVRIDESAKPTMRGMTVFNCQCPKCSFRYNAETRLPQNASLPGRWVRCSKRLPVDSGVYYVDSNSARRCYWNHESLQWMLPDILQWWEWTFPIPTPPPILQDEDKRAWLEFLEKQKGDCFILPKELFMAGRRSR